MGPQPPLAVLYRHDTLTIIKQFGINTHMQLKNKIALITGASTGIGRAIAIEFAKEGAFVILTARNKTNLLRTKRLTEKAKGKAKVITADLSTLASINTLITKVTTQIHKIDILVNVAGVWHNEKEVYANKDFTAFPQKVIMDTYMVGTIAPTLLAHALVPLMPRRGKILNISGTFNSAKGWLPYYVSKRAIEDLTVGLAQELESRDIQVNCISPDFVLTEAVKKFYPEYLDECLPPEEVAKFAVYLCSSKADSLTGKVFVMKKGERPKEGFHS